jgi:hypothetical protein
MKIVEDIGLGAKRNRTRSRERKLTRGDGWKDANVIEMMGTMGLDDRSSTIAPACLVL